MKINTCILKEKTGDVCRKFGQEKFTRIRVTNFRYCIQFYALSSEAKFGDLK
jgi:hypothetical protein